jgi:hypothetical protein
MDEGEAAEDLEARIARLNRMRVLLAGEVRGPRPVPLAEQPPEERPDRTAAANLHALVLALAPTPSSLFRSYNGRYASLLPDLLEGIPDEQRLALAVACMPMRVLHEAREVPGNGVGLEAGSLEGIDGIDAVRDLFNGGMMDANAPGPDALLARDWEGCGGPRGALLLYASACWSAPGLTAEEERGLGAIPPVPASTWARDMTALVPGSRELALGAPLPATLTCPGSDLRLHLSGTDVGSYSWLLRTRFPSVGHMFSPGSTVRLAGLGTAVDEADALPALVRLLHWAATGGLHPSCGPEESMALLAAADEWGAASLCTLAESALVRVISEENVLGLLTFAFDFLLGPGSGGEGGGEGSPALEPPPPQPWPFSAENEAAGGVVVTRSAALKRTGATSRAAPGSTLKQACLTFAMRSYRALAASPDWGETPEPVRRAVSELWTSGRHAWRLEAEADKLVEGLKHY